MGFNSAFKGLSINTLHKRDDDVDDDDDDDNNNNNKPLINVVKLSLQDIIKGNFFIKNRGQTNVEKIIVNEF